MFTGIVQAVGEIRSLEPHGEPGSGDLRVHVASGGLDLARHAVGDSIAVSGVCLTAVEIDPEGFAADVSGETLARTTLGRLAPGSAVNLEPALTLQSALGGHLVSGHVDGTGRLAAIAPEARSHRLRFEMPGELARYVAAKGSICVDGVSLTVNVAGDDHFEVNVIPHTFQVTTFGRLAEGDPVNLEVDLVARYLERLLRADR